MSKITAPELERFIVADVLLTGITLGAGAYGSVEEVEIPGARVAAKKLHPQMVNLGSPEQVSKWITDFVEECKLMSQLRHPHIVQFLGVCYLPGSPLPVLLMEKLQISLDSLLETKPDIPLDIKVYLLIGTSRGLVYLHSHAPPIAHRDLTARNILIDSGLTAKIADLGVAKMVNIQPGHLAVTMTRGPGNNLYMPPEAVQEEQETKYNIAIDIFSFGVVSLFTLTQTFPKNLKPATYPDPVTRRLLARTEVERREKYIQIMKEAIGETHSLVKLTLDCLEYFAENRPSAVQLLRRLEELEQTITSRARGAEIKLEFIQQISVQEEQIQQIQIENKTQLSIRDSELAALHAKNEELQVAVDRLEVTNEYVRAKKQAHIRRLEELVSLKERQLKVQWKENERLFNQLRSMNLPTLKKESDGETFSVVPRKKNSSETTLPLKSIPSISFCWRKRSDIPLQMSMHGQPVALNGKLYAIGRSKRTETVLEYIPDNDHWAELPSPPVNKFTIVTLKSQLLLVGGKSRTTGETMNTILAYKESSQQWVQAYPDMPIALIRPAAIGCQDYLIVAGGYNSKGTAVSDTNILNCTSSDNVWISTEQLPRRDDYRMVSIEDTLFIYLVGENTKTVLRAHIPNLIMGIKSSSAWESLPSSPYYNTSPITIGYTLLTVGGSDKIEGDSLTASIQLYDPTSNQWSGVGDLPEPMCLCNCTHDPSNDCLFVLGGRTSNFSLNLSVYSTNPTLEF